jgi:N-acylglucosamine-6-phosphate 2-epimerase
MLKPGTLVVSCQAREDNPLHGPAFMTAMARAAIAGGAGGIRANGAADIAAIRAVTDLPIIGLNKQWRPDYPVYITPDFAAAQQVSAAGADIIALDATPRPRPGDPVADLVARIKAELGRMVMADIATIEEGLAAAAFGVDYVATTLSGYTDETSHLKGADLALLEALVASCAVPIIAEGCFDTPALVARAVARGAHAVVVGTAITNPLELTRRFAAAVPP